MARLVKIAISLPDEVFQRAEDAASRLGISRSEFFCTAAERWLRDLSESSITDAIDEAIGEAGDTENDAFLTEAARRLKPPGP